MIEVHMADPKVRKLLNDGNSANHMTMLRSGNREDIKEVLWAQHENLEKYLKYSIKHDFPKEFKEGQFPIDKIFKTLEHQNNFFYFTKLGIAPGCENPHKPSRAVTIFIPGFTNQIENNEVLWNGFMTSHKQNEFYVFNWPSFDISKFKAQEPNITSSFKNDANLKDLFTIGIHNFPLTKTRSLVFFKGTHSGITTRKSLCRTIGRLLISHGSNQWQGFSLFFVRK